MKNLEKEAKKAAILDLAQRIAQADKATDDELTDLFREALGHIQQRWLLTSALESLLMGVHDTINADGNPYPHVDSAILDEDEETICEWGRNRLKSTAMKPYDEWIEWDEMPENYMYKYKVYLRKGCNEGCHYIQRCDNLKEGILSCIEARLEPTY